MQTVSVVNRKGGVGKTATAQALGAGLMKKGFKVLFIDLDSQTNLTYGLKAKLSTKNSLDLLTGTVKASEATQHTEQGDIIPASEQLAAADSIINGTGKEFKLKEALEEIQKNYDYCIIDTPAALGVLTINALTASQEIIIPVQADIYSLQGIGLLNEAIEAVKKYCNPALSIKGILLTRFNARSVISKDMRANIEEAAAQLHTKLFDTAIRECISIKEAQAQQINIFDYAQKSNAAKDYLEFVEEFLH